MKHLKSLVILFLLISFSISCEDETEDDVQSTDDIQMVEENENSQFDGSLNSIEDFFNPEIVAAMQSLGFTINTGNNPPGIIEGSYLATPFILEGSSVANDNIGAVFTDYLFNFNNQNFDTLTIDFIGVSGQQEDTGFGSFISGSDDKFSVFLKITSTFQGETAEFAYALSGRVVNDAIADFEFINLMLDNNGNPQGFWIENNTGRLLVDGDGSSPRL